MSKSDNSAQIDQSLNTEFISLPQSREEKAPRPRGYAILLSKGLELSKNGFFKNSILELWKMAATASEGLVL